MELSDDLVRTILKLNIKNVCDTCVLWVTRVRARSYAPLSVSRACIVCYVAAYAIFLAQVCMHRLASAVVSPLDCPCTKKSVHVVLDQSSWKQPHQTIRDSLSSPHACLPVVATRESTPRPEPGVCDCGRHVYVQNQAPVQVTGQTVPVFLFHLAVGFVIGVCKCVTLCCTTPTESLILVDAACGR